MGCCHALRPMLQVVENNPEISLISSDNSAQLQCAPLPYTPVKISPRDAHKSFKVIRKIGSGGFGIVYKALDIELQVIRAVKKIPKSKVELTWLFTEYSIIKGLSHPNILEIFELLEDIDFYYVVSEYCSGRDLLNSIASAQTFSEVQAASYLSQVLRALAYCHNNNVVHRDIKLENMVFENKTEKSLLKLIDFGLSIKQGNLAYQSKFAGTLLYTAPEVLKGVYNEKADLWSTGIAMYIMLVGSHPYISLDTELLKREIQKIKITYQKEILSQLSPPAMDLLRRLLHKEPERRISAIKALKHPWLTQREPLTSNIRLNSNYLARLKSFTATSKLQHAIYSYMAKYMTYGQHDVKTLFIELDLDGDGKISLEELKAAYAQMGTSGVAIETIMERCDANQNGFIDYAEFMTAAMEWEAFLSEDKIKSAFGAYDVNRKGKIELNDLKEFQEINAITFADSLECIMAVGPVDITKFQEIVRSKD